jgi:hypothetical protein
MQTPISPPSLTPLSAAEGSAGMSVAPIVDAADTCTVMRVKAGMLVTKGRTPFGGKLQETAYDNAWRFGAIEHRVGDIRKLGELIRRFWPIRSAVLRGAIVDAANHNDMLRGASEARLGDAGREPAVVDRT